MNIEQVEATLREFKNQDVAVSVPIRGFIHLTFYGPLNIIENWNDDHSFILYTIHQWPYANICFRAQDVHNIEKYPTPILAASIILIIEEHSGFKLSYEES